MKQLSVGTDGQLVWIDTSPRGILADRAISGHWRLKRGTPVVLDQRGVLRFETEVHNCSICKLWYDAYNMNSNRNTYSDKTYYTYCKHCWRDYCKWRQALIAYEKQSKTPQDKRMATFRAKYLAGELTNNPPTQVDRYNEADYLD